jgi:hypothetical protein
MTAHTRVTRCTRNLVSRLAVAGLLALLPAAELAAQECVRPSRSRPMWGGLMMGLAGGEHTNMGVEIGRHFMPELAVSLEADALAGNGGNDLLPARRQFRLTGIYRLKDGTPDETQYKPFDAYELCASLAPEFVRVGDVNILLLPVGVTFSSEWKSPSDRLRIVPHFEPRLAYRRAWVMGFTQSTAAVSVRVGATAGFGRYFGGIQYQGSLTEGDAWTTRLRFGLEF